MGLIEEVLRQTKFSEEDFVITDFEIYFDEQCRDYNMFSLNGEDFPPFKKFIELVKAADSHCKPYVMFYGHELEGDSGEKYTLAESIWLDTSMKIPKVRSLAKKSRVCEPHDISYVGEDERRKDWLITRNENGTAEVIELTDREKTDRMIWLFWDFTYKLPEQWMEHPQRYDD